MRLGKATPCPGIFNITLDLKLGIVSAVIVTNVTNCFHSLHVDTDLKKELNPCLTKYCIPIAPKMID
jgi:hypothetical protein